MRGVFPSIPTISHHLSRSFGSCRLRLGRAVGGDHKRPGDFIPISWQTVALTFTVAAGAVYYLNQERKSLEESRKVKEAEMQNAQYGKPQVGGPFTLTDCETGRQVTDADFHGKFMVVYFGFTNCPDVCPDELEKMSKAISRIDLMPDIGSMIAPVFISVDPGRDSPEIVRAYIKEFHPRFIGLTGTEEQVKAAAKQYRIYISKGEASEDDPNDYLVDHSIFFFLMDPEGGLAEFYGRSMGVDDVVESMVKSVRKWKLDRQSGRL